MEIRKLYLTKNDCYKRGKYIKPKGIMVHSTGANNPNLSRYLPDDGLVGPNRYGNHWNRPGVGACVHAFIGLDKNGEVQIYQTLPWTMRGWHCGRSGNDTHISFEICEDGLKDPVYFSKIYTAAVELCVALCKEYNLTYDSICDHSEGAKLGIASNHGDVSHWWPKHGKSMDTLRTDVRLRLMNAPQAIEQLARLGVINSPSYWLQRYRDLQYLDKLLVSLAIHATKKQAEIKALDTALERLSKAGVIDSPDYWRKNAGKIAYLDKLIISAAEYV